MGSMPCFTVTDGLYKVHRIQFYKPVADIHPRCLLPECTYNWKSKADGWSSVCVFISPLPLRSSQHTMPALATCTYPFITYTVSITLNYTHEVQRVMKHVVLHCDETTYVKCVRKLSRRHDAREFIITILRSAYKFVSSLTENTVRLQCKGLSHRKYSSSPS